MLQRAYNLRKICVSIFILCALLTSAYLQFINDFVFKMSNEETNTEKQQELRELCVLEEEWRRVAEFLKVLKVRLLVYVLSSCLTVLQHADAAQHSLSKTEPSLAHGLPALE